MELTLPEKIDLDTLRKFTFGDPDAEGDPMVRTSDCLCQPQWLTSLMQGRHSIVRGYRGAGKTALFAALNEGLITFTGQDEKDILVLIDQALDYSEIKERILPGIQTRGKKATTRYRIIWELFLMYHLALEVLASVPDLPRETRNELKEFLRILGRDEPGSKESFFSLLLRSKKRIGIEVSPSEFGAPKADVYASFGEVTELPDADDESDSIVRLPALKDKISKHLKSIGSKVYIVVDRLDEFVTEENYQTQKALMHGLILAERDYKRVSEIRLLLLFRSDLFKRLDLEDVGADKINYRTLDIDWTSNDLRQLIGRRLAFNFINHIEGANFFSKIHFEDLYSGRKESFIPRVVRKCKFWDKQVFRHKHTRMKDLKTEVLDLFVKAYFGETVFHIDRDGNKVEISIKKFLSTHFEFGFGQTTPRVMLVFCEMALEAAIDYYSKNPDIERVRFPLIPQRSTCIAYQNLKQKLWDIAEASCKGYRNHVSRLRVLSNRDKISYADVKDTLACSDKEAEEIIAMLIHQGVFYCENPVMPLYEQTYIFPLLFQDKYEKNAEPDESGNGNGRATS